MSEESLTYRDSGVDVEANLRANRRIQDYIRRTYTERVLTRSGMFGGAIALNPLQEQPRQALAGRLITAEGNSPEAVCRRIAQSCRSRSAAAGKPLAFLDYLAAAGLDADRAAGLVGILSRRLAAAPKIPIIGGETAEMPDVFHPGAWEVVGALFSVTEEVSASGPRVNLGTLRHLAQPTLVFSMDGVGTKTKLGVSSGRAAGLAVDIIHHCLDDILCQGARGIALMLYVGCHHREKRHITALLESAEKCCRSNDLVLLDSLVAEKPGLYRPGEIDICGAIAGAVDADRLIQGEAIRSGDVLIGLPSSGLHTNGYSLARKALLERGGLGLDQYLGELGCSLADALLEPHRNYAPALLPLLADRETAPAIRGIAHITGGGLEDNLERILPGSLRAEIRLDSWQPPPIFELIRRCGNIPLQDPVGKGLYESFNMGIGLVLAAAADAGGRVLDRLRDEGQQAVVIGRVVGEAAETSSRRPEGRQKRVRLL